MRKPLERATFRPTVIPTRELSCMDEGRTRGHVTGDLDATRGLWPDDIAWLASGFMAPGEVSYLDLAPILIVAEQQSPPGAGYAMHPHHGLETITLVLDGAYLHETDRGARSIVRAGDVAVVSTGAGMAHQETTLPGAPLRSIMLWARSNADGEPAFANRAFAERTNRLVSVASGRGVSGALATRAAIDVLAGTFEAVRGSRTISQRRAAT